MEAGPMPTKGGNIEAVIEAVGKSGRTLPPRVSAYVEGAVALVGLPMVLRPCALRHNCQAAARRGGWRAGFLIFRRADLLGTVPGDNPPPPPADTFVPVRRLLPWL